MNLTSKELQFGNISIDGILCAVLFKYNDCTEKEWFTAMQESKWPVHVSFYICFSSRPYLLPRYSSLWSDTQSLPEIDLDL